MTGSTISSTSAAITAPPTSIEPPGPKPSRPGPRSPAWPLGHKPSCDRPSCALSRPEPIKLTVPLEVLACNAPATCSLPTYFLKGNPELLCKYAHQAIVLFNKKAV